MSLTLLNTDHLRTGIAIQRTGNKDFALVVRPDGTLEATDGAYIAATFPNTFTETAKAVFLRTKRTIPKSKRTVSLYDYVYVCPEAIVQQRIAEVVNNAVAAQPSRNSCVCFGGQLAKVLCTLPNGAKYAISVRQDSEKMYLILNHARASIVFAGGEV